LKALILGAGRGSRMSPITDEMPKCFTELGGKKLIEWQLKALNDSGISDVTAVGGYKHEMLEEYLPVSFINKGWAQSNSVMSLFSADELLSECSCIISYSDIVYHPVNIQSLIKSPGSIAITYDIYWNLLWDDRFKNPLSDAETLKIMDGKVIEIGKKAKNLQEIEGQYMGLLKITPNAWSKIKKNIRKLSEKEIKFFDITALLSKLIENGIDVYGVPIHGKWCEIDQQSDVELYERKIVSSKKWEHDWRW